jgi:hypothetical protein
VVDRVVQLIEEQLEGVDGGCAAMLVVGGFAASPYLMKRIKLAFSERVPLIWQPPQSGSAILEGAVLYGAPIHCRLLVVAGSVTEAGSSRLQVCSQTSLARAAHARRMA